MNKLRAIAVATIFGAVGVWVGASYDKVLIISQGAEDHEIANRAFFQALDGYISVSNRYIGQLNSNELRLYRGIDEPGEADLSPDIHIGPYPGDEEFSDWLDGSETTWVEVKEERTLEGGIRYLFAVMGLRGREGPGMEVAVYIKDDKMLRVNGVDVLDVANELIESYRKIRLFESPIKTLGE